MDTFFGMIMGIYFTIAQFMAIYFLYLFCKVDSFVEILLIDWWLAELKGIFWIFFVLF